MEHRGFMLTFVGIECAYKHHGIEKLHFRFSRRTNRSSSCRSSVQDRSFLRPICCAFLRLASTDCRLIRPSPSTDTTSSLGVDIPLCSLISLGITTRPFESIDTLVIIVDEGESHLKTFVGPTERIGMSSFEGDSIRPLFETLLYCGLKIPVICLKREKTPHRAQPTSTERPP